jgi:hypothetical protein
MQVTVENFNQTLPLIQQAATQCHYFSFDSEFTGNSVTYEDKPHDFDSFQDKYRKQADAIEQFLAFEIGLTFFIWTNDKY